MLTLLKSPKHHHKDDAQNQKIFAHFVAFVCMKSPCTIYGVALNEVMYVLALQILYRCKIAQKMYLNEMSFRKPCHSVSLVTVLLYCLNGKNMEQTYKVNVGLIYRIFNVYVLCVH